jgi:hypothetical protein
MILTKAHGDRGSALLNLDLRRVGTGASLSQPIDEMGKRLCKCFQLSPELIGRPYRPL